jgi:hypothetical protein
MFVPPGATDGCKDSFMITERRSSSNVLDVYLQKPIFIAGAADAAAAADAAGTF